MMSIRSVVALLIMLMLSCGGCATSTAHRSDLPPRPALINHIVFFDLHDPADADELIADCDAMAAAIPGIASYFCGRHIDTGRSTVLADYDVGFYVGFDSIEDYETYVAHPAHRELVARWRSRTDLAVRDVVDRSR